MSNERDRESAPTLGYASVEFLGGPVDGLKLVVGIENFKPQAAGEPRRMYSTDGLSMYAPRHKPEGGVLFLDFIGSRE